MNKYFLIIIIAALSACTFKGEINDQRAAEETAEAPEPTPGGEEADEEKQEEAPFYYLDFYVFNQDQGTEFDKRFEILESETGELVLSEPLFFPPEKSANRLDYRSINDLEGRVSSVTLLSQESNPISGLKNLKGAGENEFEFELGNSAINELGARSIRFSINKENDQEQIVQSSVFQAPTDLNISFVSPPSATQRESSKDIYREEGSFFFVHKIVMQNPYPYPVEIQAPTVLIGQYLIRSFQDVTYPNNGARGIDPRNCGGAVSVRTDFTESSRPLLGLYLIPEKLDGDAFKEYVTRSTQVHSLAPDETKVFDVYVMGSGDLDLINPIFAGYSQNEQTYVSGCVQKRRWFDLERGRRHDSGKYDYKEPIQPMKWIYFGEPQYSEHTFRNGVSRVFLNFSDTRNQSLKVRPVGVGYEGTMFERMPNSLGEQKLLLTLGVE